MREVPMPHRNNALALIGDTPVVRLSTSVTPASSPPEADLAEIWLKLEGRNPGGSVKDRIALSMIQSAIKLGELRPGMTVIEPTSGNTGIGLALVCAILGYDCLLVMPESMSIERRTLLRAYGAALRLTPAAEGMRGAVDTATRLAATRPGHCYLPMQFDNPANPAAHIQTGQEILANPGLPLHAFVSGVGTGGTITGAGGVLKAAAPDISVIAVEPTESPVISGGSPGPHGIQGIGAGFVPSVLQTSLIDRVITVSHSEAVAACRRVAQSDGLLLGISSGAAIAAAFVVARELGTGHRVLAIAPDFGERYLSTGLWDGESA